MLHRITLVSIASIALLIIGCHSHPAGMETPSSTMTAAMPNELVAIALVAPSKIAATMPSANVLGSVVFTQIGSEMHVVADLTGFAPNSVHGFHIHQHGDLSAPDLASAGGHFDPMGTHHHGDPAAMADMKHAGDLGNLTADANGKVHYEVIVTGLTIGSGVTDILGKSVIIHGKADDLKSQPSGESGARIAGGVITKMAQ